MQQIELKPLNWLFWSVLLVQEYCSMSLNIYYATPYYWYLKSFCKQTTIYAYDLTDREEDD